MQLPYYDSLFEDSLEVLEIDWIIVFAFFDETGMHGSAPDTVVAGYLFSKDGAKNFRRMFQENIFPLLPPNKRREHIFHASKCIGRNDEYASLSTTDCEHIVDLMVAATKKSVSLGIVVGMEKQEYAKAIANSPMLAQLAGSEYTVCLIRCIANMAAWLDEKNIVGRVMYVFEAGCEHQEEANNILANISRSDELKKRYRWHNYAFVDKGADVPQLFAPDLLAWEWQRARINTLNPRRGEWRLTLKKLAEKPLRAQYLTEESVGINAILNSFYGITSAKEPILIVNSMFSLQDFEPKEPE